MAAMHRGLETLAPGCANAEFIVTSGHSTAFASGDLVSGLKLGIDLGAKRERVGDKDFWAYVQLILRRSRNNPLSIHARSGITS